MWVGGEVKLCPFTSIQFGIFTLLSLFLTKLLAVDIVISVLQIGKLRLRVNKSITEGKKSCQVIEPICDCKANALHKLYYG